MLLSVAFLAALAAAQPQYAGYVYSKGACRGGEQPAKNAGLVFYNHRNCKSMCDKDRQCTGFVLPMSNANWCETYTSSKAVGDNRGFYCYMKTEHAAPTPMAEGYNYSKGACRGGARPQNNAGLKFYSNRNCEQMCNDDDACSGFVLPIGQSNWCETYTSPGVEGDGRGFHCFTKKDFKVPPTPKPTPKPTFGPIEGYIYYRGACRYGARPQNNAGLKFYSDRNCKTRCDQDQNCTGYVLPMNAANWCETYTSPGVKGDGRSFHCYAKPTAPTEPPVPTPMPTVPEMEGYEYSKGACRGGGQPDNNAGLKFHRDNKCMDRCNIDTNCTGFVLPMIGEAWCETYTSPNAMGDGRNFRCYMKREQPDPFEDYDYTKGACRGGKNPEFNAGLKLYNDGDCKERCDEDETCSGFVLPAVGDAWCETYKSEGAEGDGRNFRCFMKKDWKAPPSVAPTEPPSFRIEGYSYSKGACRGGKQPGNNAGLQFFRDSRCKQRCDEKPSCTGFVLPMGEPTWCETYTSEGAKGDGRNFKCYMKDEFDSEDTDPPTPTPTEGEPDVCFALSKKDCGKEEACEWDKKQNNGEGKCMELPEMPEPFDDFAEFEEYCASLVSKMGMDNACKKCQGKVKKNKRGEKECKLPKAKKLKCKKIKNDMPFCFMLGCGNKKMKKCVGKPTLK